MADYNPLFPGPSTNEGAPAAAPSRPKSPLRWIVPLALFFLIIGGIAWLVQNMPTWRRPTPGAAPTVPKGPELLVGFVHPFDPNERAFMAIWEDINKPEAKQAKRLYAREFERGAEGRYYFPFYVHPEKASEFGVSYMSCDCAKLHLAIVPPADWEQFGKSLESDPEATPVENPAWTWQPLAKSENQGVPLAAGSRGILRMIWTNRRAAGENLNLNARVWARPAASGPKQELALKINAVSTHALRTRRDRAEVGFIGPGGVVKATFLVWSPTRDEVKFSLREKNNDKLFKIDVRPLDAAGRAALQTKLRQEEIMTRVRAAWEVAVTIHESKAGAQLDQGYFLRSIDYDVPDAADDLPPLIVTGAVRSDDILIGGVADSGKIDLKSFPARDGTRKAIFVSTNRDIELDVNNVSVQPTALRVKLTETTKDKTANKRNWSLEVEALANQLFGTISEDSAVILRTKATPPRLIRIPVVGHAVQN